MCLDNHWTILLIFNAFIISFIKLFTALPNRIKSLTSCLIILISYVFNLRGSVTTILLIGPSDLIILVMYII